MGNGGDSMKHRVFVEGPVLTQSGYGEHTRLVLRSLRKRDDILDIYVSPLNWGTTSWLLGDSEERSWLDGMMAKTAGSQRRRKNISIFKYMLAYQMSFNVRLHMQ